MRAVKKTLVLPYPAESTVRAMRTDIAIYDFRFPGSTSYVLQIAMFRSRCARKSDKFRILKWKLTN